MRYVLLFAILTVFSVCMAHGQVDKPAVSERSTREIIVAAVSMMEHGEFDKSRLLLLDVLSREPDNVTCIYEIAFSYSMQKNYRDALKYVEPLLATTKSTDQHFELAGNCYDYLGEPQKAIEVYSKGFERFPKSGRLCLELGVMFAKQQQYVTALSHFERGIVVDPMYPSNYYWASRLYLSSTEGVWGMIYGEIFVNLERNTQRTREISKLLFDSYKQRIKINNDTSGTVSFSKVTTLTVSDGTDTSSMKLPYGIGVYEPVLGMSLLSFRPITINRLDTIRTNFLDNYIRLGFDKSYPNVLFAFQEQIKEAGHLEAYNHWVLMKGDEESFRDWKEKNQQKLDAFNGWFQTHRMFIDERTTFCSTCYRKPRQ